MRHLPCLRSLWIFELIFNRKLIILSKYPCFLKNLWVVRTYWSRSKLKARRRFRTNFELKRKEFEIILSKLSYSCNYWEGFILINQCSFEDFWSCLNNHYDIYCCLNYKFTMFQLLILFIYLKNYILIIHLNLMLYLFK